MYLSHPPNVLLFQHVKAERRPARVRLVVWAFAKPIEPNSSNGQLSGDYNTFRLGSTNACIKAQCNPTINPITPVRTSSLHLLEGLQGRLQDDDADVDAALLPQAVPVEEGVPPAKKPRFKGNPKETIFGAGTIVGGLVQGKPKERNKKDKQSMGNVHVMCLEVLEHQGT